MAESLFFIERKIGSGLICVLKYAKSMLDMCRISVHGLQFKRMGQRYFVGMGMCLHRMVADMKKIILLCGLCLCFFVPACGDGDNGTHDAMNNGGNGGESGNGGENGGGENGGGENGGGENGENGENGGDPVISVEGMTCGSGVCEANAVCIQGICVARNNKVSLEGKPCQESTFVESCDGNAVVYCGQTVDDAGKTVWQVAVSDCGSAKCALRAKANFGFCVVDEPRCTATTAGRMTYCRILDDLDGNPVTGGLSYVYYYDCDQATDGQYYAFRDVNNKSDECLAGCLGDACSSTGERCTQETYNNRCDGTVRYYCSDDGTEERMECADYGTTCVETEELCDWSGMDV